MNKTFTTFYAALLGSYITLVSITAAVGNTVHFRIAPASQAPLSHVLWVVADHCQHGECIAR